MFRKLGWLLPVFALVLAAAEGSEPWKDKAASEWNDDEAKLVLSKSPWAQVVTPDYIPAKNTGLSQGQRRGGGMGRGGGIGIGGIGIGMPGQRRGGGGGYPRGGGNNGGGYPQGGYPEDAQASQKLPQLTLRWESAEPVREAELKTRDVNSPTVEDKYYAIAVYGITQKLTSSETNNLKKHMTLKRDGKKDITPARVQVLTRDEGIIVLYLMPRSKEISQNDKFISFDAEIGRMNVHKTFSVEDMMYRGKLEI